jgi:hypothetical protein
MSGFHRSENEIFSNYENNKQEATIKVNSLFFLLLLKIFTICFEEAISKLFGRLLFEGRCYPLTVLRSQVTLLIRY